MGGVHFYNYIGIIEGGKYLLTIHDFDTNMCMYISVAPSQGVQGGAAPVISPNEVHLMWMPPELENWNGNLTSYTIGIVLSHPCLHTKEA